MHPNKAFFHISLTLAATARLRHVAMALQTPSSDAAAPLFSPELISPEVLKALPEGYSCRPIQRQDYHNGFLDVLRVLTTVGDVTEEVRPIHCHLTQRNSTHR